MNHVFRLVWSRTQESLVPVPEGLTARPRGRRQLRRARRILRKTLSPGASAAAIALLGLAPAARALPVGGTVVAGQANISQSAGTTTIVQGSDRAILDWQGFGIGAGETVTFRQPSTSSVALNRVTGGEASAIYGHLDANGQVFLVNPDGIYFAPGAQVDVGGIAASTLGVDGADFMAGRPLHFSGDSTASIVNAGTVRAAPGGYVAFIGRRVANDGTIVAPGGTVALGAGGSVDLTLAGNSLLSFRVSADALDAEVRNGGAIRADDGRVVLSARARDALMKTVVNNTGTVEARGVTKTAGGEIQLLGGGSGTVAVKGRVDASAARGKGGRITVIGTHVIAGDGARILATGATGGGTIAFGGGWQGEGGDATLTATVAPTALLDASATGTGDGGTIAVWSNTTQSGGLTRAGGSLRATGGALGGDGGRIETSGHGLDVAGLRVDASAAAGAYGDWLLDPYNLTISDAADTSSGGFTAGGSNSIVNVTTLETALATANVTVQTGGGGYGQFGDLTVADPVTWSAPTTLTLSSRRAITIDAPISVTGNGGLYLWTNNIGAGSGTLSFNAPINLSAGASYTTRNGFDAPISFQIITTLGNAASSNDGSLQGIRGNLTGNYVLGADIDAQATSIWNPDGYGGYAGFTPLGSGVGGATFTGTFDGLGHTISNLHVDWAGSFGAGLFGYTSNSTIRYVRLTGGDITAFRYAGGLVGYALGGQIDNASFEGNVTATSNTTASVGGLVGHSQGTVTASSASGSASGTSNVGGLVGVNGGTIADSYATTRVTTPGTNIGGLVGYNLSGGSVTGAYALGDVTGGAYAGGLVGNNLGQVTTAFASGTIHATGRAGGLVGVNGAGGTVQKAYVTGNVTGNSATGGLIGSNAGTVSTAYTAGTATGTTTPAAAAMLIGVNSGTVSNAYWDNTTATAGAAAINTASGTTNSVSGLTTAQLAAALPAGFSSADWSTSDGQVTPWLTAHASLAGISGMVAMAGDTGATPTLKGVIASTTQLGNIARTGLGNAYVQGAPISLGSVYAQSAPSSDLGTGDFQPIGDAAAPFTGSYDGLGYAITGLNIYRPGTGNQGLFGVISGAGLSNLRLLSASVTGTDGVGIVVGSNIGGTLSGITVEGQVSGTARVGGIAGVNGGTLARSYATVTVSAGDAGGGLVGSNTGTISNDYANGTVAGGTRIGGLAGVNAAGGTIAAAYATGAVSGSGAIGGLVGSNAGTIAGGYFDTTTQTTAGLSVVGTGSGSATNTGGLGTAALAASLPSGFSAADWSTSDGKTTPWLTAHESRTTISGKVILASDTSATPTYFNIVATPTQLQNITTTGLNLDFALGRDIDMSGIANFTPLGTYGGTFDGTGHTISNLTIHQPNLDNVGLFSSLSSYAVVRNLTLANVDVSGSTNTPTFHYVGALAGGTSGRDIYGAPGTSVSNVTVSGTVSGGLTTFTLGYGAVQLYSNQLYQGIGGLVGAAGGQLSGITSSVNVSGVYNVGGIAGYTFQAQISDSSASGAITGASGGSSNVGGIIGKASNHGVSYDTLNNVWSTGSVSGLVSVGGLVGFNRNHSTIANSYSSATVTGVDLPGLTLSNYQNNGSAYIGGLVGRTSNSRITDSHATGNVTGSRSVGGLAGGNSGGTEGTNAISTRAARGTIVNSYATGKVSGVTQVGGLVGNEAWGVTDAVHSTVTSNSYATGTVTGGASAGGLIGATEKYSTVTGSYATGSVTGGTYFGTYYGLRLGGLVGSNRGTLSDVHATGAVTGIDAVGGLVGQTVGNTTNAASIANAYATGAVSGAVGVGGLVGRMGTSNASSNTAYATIASSYATGAATGTASVGGLVGSNKGGGIDQSFATGAVTGTSNTGGLVGLNKTNGTVTDVYATGRVTATGGAPSHNLGGLVGINQTNATVSNAYATGVVTPGAGGSSGTGALAGNNQGTLSDTYWASASQSDPALAGIGSNAGTGAATALDAAQMQQGASFTGFDFSTNPDWVIYDGHTAPLLAAFMTPLTVTPAAASVTYDGQVLDASSLTTQVTGTAPAGTLFGNSGTLNGTATPFGTSARDVGSYTLKGMWSDQLGYRIILSSGTIEITPRILTGSITTGSSAYGNPLAPGSATLTNVVPGDVVSATVGVDTTGNLGTGGYLNAGTYATGERITALSGKDAGNYDASGITGIYTVTPLSVTASIQAGSSIYGDPLAPGAGSVSGVLAGDVVGVAVTVDTTGNLSSGGHLNAGSYTGIQHFGDLTGADAGNYTVAVVTPADYTVTPRSLTGSVAAGSSTYGDALAPGAAALAGLVSGDDVAAVVTLDTAGHLGTGGHLNAGSYTGIEHVTGLTGGDAANYTLGTIAAGDYTVGTRVLGGSITTAGSTYGDALAQGTAQFTNLVPGDVVSAAIAVDTTGHLSGAGHLAAGSHTGIQSVSGLSGTDAGNYTVGSVLGNYTVTPRALSATIGAGSSAYGASLTPGGLALSGMLSGDDVSGAATVSFGTADLSTSGHLNAGSYSQAGALSGADAANYTLPAASVADGGYVVTPLTLTGAIAAGSSTYGDALVPGAVQFSNLVSNDSVSASVAVDTGGHLSTGGHLNAGSYTAIQSVSGLTGPDAGNYRIGSFIGGDYSVTPRVLGGAVGAGSSTYGDALAPGAVSYGARATGDDVTATVNIDTSGNLSTGGHLKAGSYAGIQQVTGLTGADAANYSLGSFTDAGYTVGQRSLQATIGSVTATYGTVTSPTAGSVTLAGAVTGDVVSAPAQVDTPPGDQSGSGHLNAGHYSQTLGQLAGADAANYTIGGLTARDYVVTPRLLDGAIASGSVTYGAATPAGAVTYATRIAGDDVAANVTVDTTGNLSISGHLNAGYYAGIQQVAALSGADAANYAIGTFTGGDYTVARRALTIAITGDPSKLYDQTDVATLLPSDYTLGGLASGDGFVVTQATGTYATANIGTAIPVTATLAPADFSGLSGTATANYLLPTMATGPGTIRSLGLTSIALLAQNNATTWLPLLPSTGGLGGAPAPQDPNLTIRGGGVNAGGTGAGPT